MARVDVCGTPADRSWSIAVEENAYLLMRASFGTFGIVRSLSGLFSSCYFKYLDGCSDTLHLKITTLILMDFMFTGFCRQHLRARVYAFEEDRFHKG